MRQTITLIMLAFMFSASAQTEKSWVLGVNLGYKYQNKGTLPLSLNNPMVKSSYGTNINKELNLAFHLGRKLNDNIVLGLGISSFISRNEVDLISGSFFQGKGIGPVFYLDYIRNIMSKLSIAIKGYMQYDFCKYEVDDSFGAYGGYGNPYIDMTKEYKYQFLNTGLRPSFRFDINEKIGLELTFGKIEYRKKTKDHNYQTKYENASLFKINMKPQDWLIGLYINF